MYVLDTNVISELRRGKPAQSVGVCAWAAGVEASQQFLSVITIMELEMGILSLERKTPAQGSNTAYMVRWRARGVCRARAAFHRGRCNAVRQAPCA